jgi:predicted dehydrogenase
MKQVKLGIIGCGVIGAQHVQSGSELGNCEVVAIADRSEARAAEVAAQYRVPSVYYDSTPLLDDPNVEAVILALPAGLRVGMAIEAIRRGKHVLLEKPAALNVAELQSIWDEAAASPGLIVAGCSSRYQFLPHTKAVTDFVATGALGELRVIHFRATLPPGPQPTSPPPSWRVSRSLNGGGILVNWGIYELDYFFGLTGWKLKPRHVLARYWGISPQFSHYVDPGSDADEHFSAFITCENGTAISYERGERVASRSETIARIVGTKGSLSLSMFPEEGKKILFHNSASDKGVWDEVIWEGDEDWTPTRVGVVDDFADGILHKRPPQTDLNRAMIMQKVTDAIYQSADTGTPIEIG